MNGARRCTVMSEGGLRRLASYGYLNQNERSGDFPGLLHWGVTC